MNFLAWCASRATVKGAALHGMGSAAASPVRNDSPVEGTGFELPVRGRGQSGCRPFYAAESSGRCALSRGRNPSRRRTQQPLVRSEGAAAGPPSLGGGLTLTGQMAKRRPKIRIR
jgi:hypothetical protein